ncbi:YidC/Oxa1 family membrane protein insertase [Peristeroidobacter soli]|uniref:YidC/Oxa1 family membrane protein insertase n=1 Tax=Peristeroidobacter soli TaxID=2497877 RepID=UPI00101CB5D2|nr:YidC/Oxa1 family membrane protein insertase [Peristeroidobacter soli]
MLDALEHVFVDPLMLIYAFIYHFPERWILDAGVQLILFSVMLNLLLMPLYRQMEQRSAATREIRQRVASEVARMKRHFRGRERYFYIRAVYRNYKYHPISELLGSADLLVQIVVFFTVFHYLSGLDAVAGQSFGPIADLSRPDGLLGGVHLLPLLMTAINAASTYYYVDDPSKRWQAWALAAVFLVLLYGSPAALVLYWTTNNLFSLIRNILARRMRSGSSTPQFPTFARFTAQR